jgi:hypothetical protein
VIGSDVLANSIIIYPIKKINHYCLFGIGFARKINMKQILIVLSLILFISEISFAQVYKWVDEKGVVYFTDDINLVPEKYRSGAKKIGSSEETGEVKGDGEASPKRKEDPYKDRLGRGEDYWKGLMEDWKKKLKELQDNSEILRNRYNELTEKYNDSKSTVERGTIRKDRDLVKNEMDQNKIQIEEAKNMIEKKIPEEAELYKAKPEWLKQ